MRAQWATRSLTLSLVAVTVGLVGACWSDDAVAPSTTAEPAISTIAAALEGEALRPGGSIAAPTTDDAGQSVATSAGLVWAQLGGHEEVFEWRSYRAMEAVTAGGPGLVAVGQDFQGVDRVAAVWTSSDGLEWSRVPFDDDVFGGVQVKMSAVAAGGPGLVAVGRAVDGVVGGAAVWTSVDGLVWARVPHDDDVFGGAAMESVTAGGPGLVAVGAAGSVWTSPDGLDWKLVYRANESMDGSAARMSSVVAHGSGLVAVGSAADGGGAFAAVWTSADGLDWSQVPRDGSVFGGGTAMNSVVAGGPGLVAVGEAMRARGSVAAVWTSVDGQVWSRAPHDAQLFGGRSRVQLDCNRHHDEALDDEPDHHRLWHVASWGSGLVALGSASQCGAQVAAVWTSTDGHVWSRVPHDDGAFGGGNPPELRDVVPWASGLVAVGAANLDFADNADAAVWLSPPPQPQGNND